MLVESKAVVDGLYQALLNRPADVFGKHTYEPIVASGADGVTQVIKLILGCEEFLTQQHHLKAPDKDRWTSVEHFGSTLIVPSDSDVIAEIRSPAGYEPHVLPFFIASLRPGMRVLDIGASLGTYAIPAAVKVGDDGRVFAVDVSSTNCGALQRSVMANRLTNVTILPLGASDHVGAEMISNQIHHHNYTIARASVTDATALGAYTLVPTLPLDILGSVLGNIDVIKMDIEGSEYDALRGLSNLLTMRRPKLFVEYSPGLLTRVSKIEPIEMIKFLHGLGYRIEILHRSGHREGSVGGELSAVVERFEKSWEATRSSGGTHLDVFAEPEDDSAG